jgi:hypothetical protein
MFPIQPPPLGPKLSSLRVITRITPVMRVDEPEAQEGSPPLPRLRRQGDRRLSPFVHRGPFEMRSGRDRRVPPEIDTQA